jgi:YggT family protein
MATLFPILALTRADVAGYVSALFTVYIVLIFIRILMSWIPRLPDNAAIQAVAAFTRDVTDPYLNIFRRFIPPIGGGGMALDLSPVLGVILLLVLQGVVVGIING